MRVIKTYPTKAKWAVPVDAQGLPNLGYDRQVYEGDTLPVGQNLLLHGSLMMLGSSRGMSAAKFDFVSASGWYGQMTLKGGEDLFRSIADGHTTVQTDTWMVRIYEEPEEVEGAVFRGYWTVAKRGSEISLIAAPSQIIP